MARRLSRQVDMESLGRGFSVNPTSGFLLSVLSTAGRDHGGPKRVSDRVFFHSSRAPRARTGKVRFIHRLKEKLGVRSMATGEITFENAEANLLGGEAAALADTEEELLRAGYSAEG